jgi:hypothetical protein
VSVVLLWRIGLLVLVLVVWALYWVGGVGQHVTIDIVWNFIFIAFSN